MKYEARITEVTVVPVGEPLFHENATVICIEDEATAGEFVKVQQHGDHTEDGLVVFEVEDWSVVRGEIDAMVVRCRKENN